MNKRGDVVLKDIFVLLVVYILMISIVSSTANITISKNSTGNFSEEIILPELANNSGSESVIPQENESEVIEKNETIPPIQNETITSEINETEMISPVNITEPIIELVQKKAKVGEKVKWVKRAYTTDPNYEVEIPITAKKIDKPVSFSSSSASNETKDYIEVEYETSAPRKTEINFPDKKEVLIYSDIHYENVSATTDIDFDLDIKEKNSLKVYWKEQDKYLDFEAFDSNNDSLIDYIEWTVPHLSNQTFEIFINVINVQSFPMVGGEWQVRFETKGRANLTIKGIDGTAFDEDLRFFELKCGETNVDYEYSNGVVFVEDYECLENSSETSRVLTPGKHHLEFSFGDSTSYAHNAADDFKVQRGYTIFTAGQANATITAGVDYDAPVGEAFIRLTNTRLSGMGRTAAGGNQNVDDFTVHIANPTNLATSIDFSRFGTTNDNRISWEIVEYTGPVNGYNRFNVRQAGVQIFGSASLTSDTAAISGITDDNDVVVFITGQANPDTGRTNANTGMHTSEWIAASNISRFTRGEAGSDATRVSYAVVEFTGENWKVQRKEHNYTAAGVTETESITQVNLSTTFLHVQHRAGSGMGGLDEQGAEVYLSTSSELGFQLVSGAGTTGQSSVAWVIENNLTDGTPMNVQHMSGSRGTSGTEEDIWTDAITTVSAINTTSIMGETASSTGTGTAYPRGFITIQLMNTTTVEYRSSDSGQTQYYRYDVVEWPTAAPVDFPQFFNASVNNTMGRKDEIVRFSIDVNDTSNSIASVNGTINGANYSFTQGAGDQWYYDWQCSVSDNDVSFTYAEASDDGATVRSNSTTISGVTLVCDADNPSISFITPDTPANDSSLGDSFFAINLSITETNFANMTYFLYNDTDLVNQTTYFSSTPDIFFSNLLIGNYYYNITIYDQVGQTNFTETRQLYLDPDNPLINYSSNNPFPGQVITGTSVFLNVTVIEPNEANITFELFDDTHTQERETIYTDGTRSLTWTLVPEGLHFYNVTIYDIFNHVNYTTTRNITLDNTPPTVDYTTGTEINEANKSQSFVYINTSVTETNFANITFGIYNASGEVNKTIFTSLVKEINFSNLIDGPYSYNVTVVDKAGQSTSTTTRNITLDTLFPQISFSTGTENTGVNRSRNWAYLNISLIEDNFANITFYLYNAGGLVNQTIFTDSTREINFTNLASDVYYYNVTAYDFAGNLNFTETRMIGLDTLGPVITIVDPEAKAYGYNTSLPLNYTVVDAIVGNDSCWWNLDDTANQSITCGTNTTFNTSEGGHTLYFFSNDTFGNVGSSQVSFSVSTTGPAIALIAPDNDTFYNALGIVEFNYSATDPDGVENCSLYGSWGIGWHKNQTTGNQGNYSADIQEEGTIFWNVMCNDTIGYNTWGLNNYSFTMDLTDPAVYYAAGTEDDKENKSQTWIYVNTNVVESNFKNITFNLYNTTSLIEEDTFTDSTREINWTGLSDGTYYYNVTVFDKAGNNETSETRSITLDTLAPEGNLLSPPDNSYVNNATQNFTANFTDATGLKEAILFIFNSTGSLIYQSTPISLLNLTAITVGKIYNFIADGIYQWFYQVEDIVGNKYNTTNYTVTVDTTLPVVIFIPATESSGVVLEKNYIYLNISTNDTNFQNITFGLYDDEGIVFENTFTDSTREINWTLLADDFYYYNVTVVDKASNSNFTETRNISLDNTNPTVVYTTGTEEDESVITGTNVFLNVTVTEPNEANITFKLFDDTHTQERTNTFTDGKRSLTWTLVSEGIHYYNVTVYDVLGHKGISTTRNITLDNTPPTVDYTTGTEINEANKSQSFVYINTSVTETNFANITFGIYNASGEVNKTTFTSLVKEINFSNLIDGPYSYNVTVVDKAGQSTSTTTRNITLDTLFPQISFSTGTENDGVNRSRNWAYLNTSLTEDNFANITFYLYNAGGIVNQTTFTDSTREINFTNLASDVYYYNVTAYDFAGNLNFTETRTIGLDTLGPVVTIVYPEAKAYGYNVSLPLNYTAVDAIVGTDSCWWNLDDTANQSISCGTNTTFNTSEGGHTLYFFSNDTFGNVGSSQVSFSVSVTGPAMVLLAPENDTFYGAATEVSFMYSAFDPDGVEACSLYGSWNGGWHLNQTYSGDWSDPSWSYRKEINITNVGTTTLSNFPVYLNITNEADMQSDYDDIRIFNGTCASGNTTPLSYEIEDYSAANANVWLKMPSLATGINTICLYYGNPDASNGEDETGVWSSSYTSVYHLDHTSGTAVDTLGNWDAENGVSPTSNLDRAGVVGGADYLDGSDYLGTNPEWDVDGAHTYCVWTKFSSGHDGTILEDGGLTDGTGLGVTSTGEFRYAECYNNVHNPLDSTTTYADDNWHYVCGGHTGTLQFLYVDGALAASATQGDGLSGSGDARIGAANGANPVFDDNSPHSITATLDEIRVSSIDRSADWINQSYQQIENYSSYISFGSEEPFIAFTVNISDEGTHTWNVECNDTIGYYKFALDNFTFIFDVTDPEVNFTTGTDIDNANRSRNWIYVNASVVENNFQNITFSLYNTTSLVQEDTFTDSTREINWTSLPDTTYYYNITVVDQALHTGNSSTRTILLDTVFPEGSLIAPSDNAYVNNATQNFTANFSDAVGLKEAILFIFNSTGSLIYQSAVIPLLGATIATVGTIYNLISDGIYQWFYQVEDSVGNQYNTTNYTITVDATLPLVDFIPSTEDPSAFTVRNWIYLNTSVNETNFKNITFSLYDGEGIEFENTFTDSTRAINWTLLPDDEYYYNVTVWDQADNVNYTETRNITLDNVVPSIVYSTGTDIDFANRSRNWIYVNTSVTETNFQNITFYLYNTTDIVNSTTYTSLIEEINWTSLPDATYYYNVTVIDKAGQSASTATRNINLDTTFPQISFILPTENTSAERERDWIYLNTSLIETNFQKITFNLYDTNGLINQSNYTSLTTEINFSASSENITYYYNVTAYDFAGNFNSTETRSIKLFDNTVPSLILVYPENTNYSYNTSIKLWYNAVDKHLDSCWYNIDDAANITLTSCQNTTISVADETYHTLKLFINDTLGYVNSTNATFFVNSSAIPTDVFKVFRDYVFVDGITDVPIDQTDLTKAFIIHTTRGADNGPDSLQVTPDFLDVNNLRFENYDSGEGVIVEWSVIVGPNLSVQRGEIPYTNEESLNLSINSVNLSSSFIIVNNRLDTGDSTKNVDGFWAGKFVDATNITFSRGSNASSGVLSYQIVNWAGADVQSGNLNINTVTSGNSTINSVNLNKSFTFFSRKLEGDNSIQDLMVRGRLKNSTNIEFNRVGSGGNISIEWFVIQSALLNVRYGNYTHLLNSNPQYIDMSRDLINTSRSFDIHSNDNAGVGTSFSTAFVTQNIYNTSSLVLQKGTSSGAGQTDWFSIEITELDSPVVNLESPINNFNSSVYNLDFNFSVADESEVLNCSLYGNWSAGWHANKTVLSPATESTANFSNVTVDPDDYYVWNVKCIDAYGNIGWNSTNFSLAAFLPPGTPFFYNITQTSNDGLGNISLFWNVSNHSEEYRIYGGINISNLSLITTTTIENYTDSSFSGNRRKFYQIEAWNPSGTNTSEFYGTHVYTLEHDLTETKNWIAFPTNFTYLKNANETFREITNATDFTLFNSTTQRRVTCNEFSCPEILSCTDTNCNFELEPGRGYEVNINSSGPQVVNWSGVGKVYSPQSINLTKNATSFGKNWITLTANTTLTNAAGLISNISNADALSRWNASDQNPSGLIPSPFPWIPGFIGKNFNLNLEEGYEVSVTSSGSWMQQ